MAPVTEDLGFAYCGSCGASRRIMRRIMRSSIARDDVREALARGGIPHRVELSCEHRVDVVRAP